MVTLEVVLMILHLTWILLFTAAVQQTYDKFCFVVLKNQTIGGRIAKIVIRCLLVSLSPTIAGVEWLIIGVKIIIVTNLTISGWIGKIIINHY